MNSYDVVIIGGGTAGLLLARELGRFKHKTLILDQKNNLLDFSFKTLGSFINLDDFQLSEKVIAQKISKAVLYSKNFKRTLNVNAYILDKEKIHEELLESLDYEHVTIKLGVAVKEILSESSDTDTYTAVVDKNGNKYVGKMFVDASGTNGVLSKKVGLQNKKITLGTGVEYNVKYLGKQNEGHLFIGKQYQGGYGWIFPLQNERAIVGFGSFDSSIVKDLKVRLNTILELPVIKKLVVKDNEKVEGGSIPLTPVLDRFVVKNLVCVGDSVSQVNPIAGEGYKFIFESAIMASKSINKSIVSEDFEFLHEYEQQWRNRFLKSYKRAKFSQNKLFKYSKSDSLMDIALFMSKLRSNDSLAKSLSGEFDN